MLIKEKNKINYFFISKPRKKNSNFINNLKNIQFSNKKDKNLSLNIDEYLYGK